MQKKFFNSLRVRNINKTGKKCEVCKKGDEVTFEYFIGENEGEKEWELFLACLNLSCEYFAEID